MTNNAIRRKDLSQPVKRVLPYLTFDRNISVLDYGCGHGDDLRRLKKWFRKVDGYDPNYRPTPIKGKYNIIFCTFVLNVIESKAVRQDVINNILKHLIKGGVAFITVRRDIEKGAKQQYDVKLPYKSIFKNGKYEIYHLENK